MNSSMRSQRFQTATVQLAPTVTEEPERLLLRGGEVARMLGISRALAFRWMKTGVLPTMRVPGARTVRVPRAALLKFIEERTQQAVDD